MPDPAHGQPAPSGPQAQKFLFVAAVLTLCWAAMLWRFFRFAAGDELYSFIPLMPFVCAYMAWMSKAEFPARSAPACQAGAGFIAAAAAATAGYWLLARAPVSSSVEALFAAGVLAWLLYLAGAGCVFLGGAAMRHLAFPFCLLLFMVPFPAVVREHIEAALQQGSALATDWMFFLSGTPYMRSGLEFRLPDITLQVAPECSGIHSTWILLITSLVAGQMILRRPGSRIALCMVVIPLALLRNGFRVFVIGELCVHIGPRMIDSPIHHHGGPLFFALSLIPFFLLLWYLRKRETARPVKP
jgi:exosortase C (VPDSG-CTERM-specific)